MLSRRSIRLTLAPDWRLPVLLCAASSTTGVALLAAGVSTLLSVAVIVVLLSLCAHQLLALWAQPTICLVYQHNNPRVRFSTPSGWELADIVRIKILAPSALRLDLRRANGCIDNVLACWPTVSHEDLRRLRVWRLSLAGH